MPTIDFAFVNLSFDIRGSIVVIGVSSMITILQCFGWGEVDPGMMGWGGMGFGWMWIGPILAALFIGLIIYGIFYIFSGRGSETSKGRSLEILNERYAKGEIAEEEFKRMRNILSD